MVNTSPESYYAVELCINKPRKTMTVGASEMVRVKVSECENERLL